MIYASKVERDRPSARLRGASAARKNPPRPRARFSLREQGSGLTERETRVVCNSS